MVRSALCCAQQHCKATLNISVCCTARHRRYILPVARYRHKTQHSAVKCVQSVWAALLFGIETLAEIIYLQLGDRGRFWPNYKVLIFYCYKTNVHILTKLHGNYSLRIPKVYTKFQEDNQCEYIHNNVARSLNHFLQWKSISIFQTNFVEQIETLFFLNQYPVNLPEEN